MKHAYLILAHNEFGVVERLLSLLDDARNDIFIHWDAKVQEPPVFHTSFSRLVILEERIDVRWGDVSVVEAELNLFRKALTTDAYEYFHLLSGVDMPLKSQNYIHRFFEQNRGKEFIGYSSNDTSKEILRKVQRWHLFPKSFKSNSLGIRITRSLFIKMQEAIGWRRNKQISFKKGTQWVSVTNSFVRYLLQHENEIKQIYRHTFCSDEIALQTICWNSNFRDYIFDIANEGHGCLRAIKWNNNRIEDWSENEVNDLLRGEYLFARKFSTKQLEMIDKMVVKLKTDDR